MDPSKSLFIVFVVYLYAASALCNKLVVLTENDITTWALEEETTTYDLETTTGYLETTTGDLDITTGRATTPKPTQPLQTTKTTSKVTTTTPKSTTTTMKATTTTAKPFTTMAKTTTTTQIITTTTAKTTATAKTSTTAARTTTPTTITKTTAKPATTTANSMTTSTSAATTKSTTTTSKSTVPPPTSCGLPAITPCLPSSSSNSNCSKQKIVGGREAQPNSYPWQVALFTSDGSFFCGGSIVHQQWIITAAHCVQGNSAASVKVLVGAHSKQETNHASVSQIIVHPNYNANTNDNDIALLKLSSSLSFNAQISPVCVARPADGEVGITIPVVATGWGTMGDGTLATVLQEVQLALTTAASCNNAYNGEITAQMICASGSAKDTCQGDSGGPLVYKHPTTGRFTLVGATSFGQGCADPKYPGVYAKVSAFHSWFSKYIPNI